MNEFASEGLRVLMFGQKMLPSGTTKDSLKEEPLDNLEDDIELLGITGLEDLLQDNVAECIKQFRDAKIKVWMLTGDKGETAENIGETCGLIDKKRQMILKIDSN
jgi:magnesium-transporting ATPase (P-type)